MVGKDATNTERRGERPRFEFNVNNAMHYGNILEYLSLWSEVQFLNVQNSKISKKSENLPKSWTSLQRLARKLKNVDLKL